MKRLASTIAPHREGPAHKLRTLLGRTPLYSQPPGRQSLITKIAGILTIVIASAFITGTVPSSRFALDATMDANSAQASVTHVVVDGLHIAIPSNLAYIAIDELIALP